MAPEVEARTLPQPPVDPTAEAASSESPSLVVSPLRDFNLRGLDAWEAYLNDREKLELDEAKGLLKRLWGSTGYAFISGQTENEWIQKKYAGKKQFLEEIRRGLKAGEAPNIALLLEKIDKDPNSPWQKDAHHYRTFARQLADTQVEVELIDALQIFPPKSETKLSESMSSAFDLESRGAKEFSQALYALVQKDFAGSPHQKDAERGLKALNGESDLGRSFKKVLFGIDPADVLIETGLFLLTDGLANAAKSAAVRLLDMAAEGLLAKGIKAFTFAGASTAASLGWRSARHDPEMVWKPDHVAKSFGVALVMAPVQGAASYLGEGVGLHAAQRLGWMQSGGVAPSARGEVLIEGAQHLYGFGGTVLVSWSLADPSINLNDVLAQSAVGYLPWGVQKAASGGKVIVANAKELDPVIREQAIAMARTKLEQWQENPSVRLELEDFFLLVETGHLPPAERERVQTLWAERSFQRNEVSAPYVSVAEVTGPHSPELVPTLKELMPILYENYAKQHHDDYSNMTDFVICGAGNCQARGKLTTSFADRRGMGPTHQQEDMVLGVQMFSDHIQPVVYHREFGIVWDPWTGQSKTRVIADIYDPAVFFFSFLKKQGQATPWTEKDFLIVPSEVQGVGGWVSRGVGEDNQGHFSLPVSSVAFGRGPVAATLSPPPTYQEMPGVARTGAGGQGRMGTTGSPLLFGGAALAAAFGSFGGLARYTMASRTVNPDSDDKLSPLAYRMVRSKGDQGYMVWESERLVPTDGFGLPSIFDGDLAFTTPQDRDAFLKLKSTPERVQFLMNLTEKRVSQIMPKDLEAKFLRLQLAPHQTIRDLSVEELRELSEKSNRAVDTLMRLLGDISKLNKVNRELLRIQFAQKHPWVNDRNMVAWSQWIGKNPTEFLTFFDELPHDKKPFVMALENANVDFSDHILFEAAGSQAVPPTVPHDDPVFGPVPGVNVTEPMKVEDLTLKENSDGQVSETPPEQGPTTNPEPDSQKPKVELSKESLVILNFWKDMFALPAGKPGRPWTPEMSRTLAKLNQTGAWDNHIYDKILERPTPIKRMDYPAHFQPVLDGLYQRHPEWFVAARRSPLF